MTSFRKVYVLVVAAHPDDIEDYHSLRKGRYEETGEEDWQPFAHSSDKGSPARLRDILKKLEGPSLPGVKPVDVVYFSLNEFKNTPNVLFERARARAPILLIVDPWTITHLKEKYEIYLELFRDNQTKDDRTATIVYLDSKENEPDIEKLELNFTQVCAPYVETTWRMLELEAIVNDPNYGISNGFITDLRSAVRYVQKSKLARTGATKPQLNATLSKS
jgi:hypothetical protein